MRRTTSGRQLSSVLSAGECDIDLRLALGTVFPDDFAATPQLCVCRRLTPSTAAVHAYEEHFALGLCEVFGHPWLPVVTMAAIESTGLPLKGHEGNTSQNDSGNDL